MSITQILVVDDDPEMRQMIMQLLGKHGLVALPAANENDIKKHIASSKIDLILLDVMLGDESGIEICAKLRERDDVPIIMVSALSTDQQRMSGYAVGADDYIAKPFNTSLLMARIKAVLSRSRRTASIAHRRRLKNFAFSGWQFDGRSDVLTSPKGVQVALSSREVKLLQTLLANPHIPLTREEIAGSLDVTGSDDKDADSSGRAIDVLVGRLRAKIEANPKQPVMLKTQRGIGYIFSTDVDVTDA